MEQLRCLVCQGQSIADSDAELAGDMRDLVRRRIAAGEKPQRDPRLADPALRYVDQLQADRRACRLAAVACAARTAAHWRVADPPANPGEEALMGWLILLLLIALSLGALRLLGFAARR